MRHVAIRHAGLRLLDATSGYDPSAKAYIDQIAELARASVEEIIQELREAYASGETARVNAVVQRLESMSKAKDAEPPSQEELLDAGRRNKILASHAGNNNLEKAVTFLSANYPAFTNLSWSEQVFEAGRFCHSGQLPKGCSS